MKRLGGMLGCLGLTLLACGPSTKPTPPDPCDSLSCGEHGRCVVAQGKAECDCDDGYVVIAGTCASREQPCSANPCRTKPGSVCTNGQNGAFSCDCPADRVEVGMACVVANACTPNPCTTEHQRVCTLINGAASCSCDPGFAPVGTGCATTPSWNCAAKHSGGSGDDVAEPDECPSLATELFIETEYMRSIWPAGDHDWLSLTVVPGRVYRIDVTTGAALPLLLEIFDSAGLTVLAAENSASEAPRLRFFATAAMKYLRVRALRASDIGSYRITFSELGADDYPNDIASALTVGPPTTLSGALQYPGDVDVVKLQLLADTAYRLTDATGLDAGQLVYELTRADGGSAPVVFGPASVARVARDEEVALSVRGRNSQTVVDWRVFIEDLGPDDHGDMPLFASPVVANGQPRTSRFERLGDVDVLSLEQVTGHIYSLTGQQLGTVQVVDESGTSLVASSYATAWKASSDARAYVLIGGSWYVSSYSWAIADLGFDDHADSEAAATSVTPGTPASGRFELASDVDAFSFVAVAQRIYQVNVTGAPSLQVDVRDASGAQVTSFSDRGGFIATSSGRYVVLLRNQYWNTSAQPYTLSITDVGLDDHGGTRATATALTVGTAASGSIQYGADVDSFSVVTTANHVYSVTCTNQSGNGCDNLTLTDAAGQSRPQQYGGEVSFLSSGGSWGVNIGGSGWGGGTLGAYTLTVVDLGLEDHGGTPLTATTYPTLGQPVTGNIGYAGDVDVFSVPTVAGHIYRVNCSFGFNCAVSLRDLSGQPTSQYETPWAFIATSTGTAYVAVEARFGAVTFAYSLTVTDLGVDDHGNSFATATPVTIGTPVAVSLQYADDVDAFVVPVSAGHFYTVSCSGQGSCSAQVETQGGTGIASGNGSGPAVMQFKAETTTSLALLIRPYGPLADVTLTVSDLGVDDHGDTESTATSLVYGTPASGLFEIASDVDAFVISATGGDVIRATCTTSGTGQCQVEIVPTGAGGSQGSFNESPFGALASATGTYLVLVRGYNGATSYTLRVEKRSDDHGDGMSTPGTALTLANPQVGAIDYLSDVDAFTVSLTAGAPRTITINSSGSLTAYIFDPIGQQTYLYVNSVPLGYTPQLSGTYVIRINSWYQLQSYSVLVQ